MQGRSQGEPYPGPCTCAFGGACKAYVVAAPQTKKVFVTATLKARPSGALLATDKLTTEVFLHP
jgi:hypothetical protein